MPAGAELDERRVPGLRRSEVAGLAGISVDYYVKLEQGRARNVSAQVLSAVARALRLDEVELAHVQALARPPMIRRVAAERSSKAPRAVRSMVSALVAVRHVAREEDRVARAEFPPLVPRPEDAGAAQPGGADPRGRCGPGTGVGPSVCPRPGGARDQDGSVGRAGYAMPPLT
jgi:transcriptional regulator with XRE-family HTH domain